MRTFTLLLTVIAAAIAGSAAVVARPQTGHSPATVKDVMLTMTIPASDVIFGAASEPPKDDMQWADVRKNASMLADSGRVLMRPALAKDNAMWMDMARALVKEAEGALAAAETRETAALEKAADDIYMTCETCHVHYMNPGN